MLTSCLDLTCNSVLSSLTLAWDLKKHFQERLWAFSAVLTEAPFLSLSEYWISLSFFTFSYLGPATVPASSLPPANLRSGGGRKADRRERRGTTLGDI